MSAKKNQGNQAFAAGRYDEAVSCYREALKVDGNDDALTETLHSNLAAALLKLERFSEALTAADAALKINPANPKARYRRASALAGLGHVSDALRECSALRGEPAAEKLFSQLRAKASANLAAKSDDLLPDKLFAPALQYSEKLRAGTDTSAEDSAQVVQCLRTARALVFKCRRLGFVKFATPIVFELLKNNAASPAVQAAAASLLKLLLAPSLDEDVLFQRRTGAEIEPDPEAAAARNILLELAEDANIAKALLPTFQSLIRRGVGQSGDDQEASPISQRTRAAAGIADVIRYAGSLESDDSLKLLEQGVTCVESDPVASAALCAAAQLAESRRRKGSRVTALKMSRPLTLLLESVISRLEDLQQEAEGTLAALLTLLADKDRAPGEEVSIAEIAGQLIVPLLGTVSGARALGVLAATDREAFSSLLMNGLGETLLDMATSNPADGSSAQLLGRAMETADGRNIILAANGCERLLECIRQTASLPIAVALTKLCLHDLSLVQKNPEFLDLAVAAAQKTLDHCTSGRTTEEELKTCRRELSEVLCFLALHGRAKETLLRDGDLVSRLFRFLADDQTADSLVVFFTLSALAGLLRSREDKELKTKKHNPGAPDLDDEQRAALDEFFQKLPAHSRPQQNGQWDRGSPEVAAEFRQQLHQPVLPYLTSVTKTISAVKSLGVWTAIVDILHLLAEISDLRPRLLQLGALPLLLKAVEQFTAAKSAELEPVSDLARRVVALLLIQTNPAALSYTDRLSAVSALLPLLENSYELYQYEAALALTNLISDSSEARDRVFYRGGWRTCFDLATSDNDLCRAAGLEAMCNMALCEHVVQRVAAGSADLELKVLLCFVNEAGNERAQRAASGCLAMLSAEPRCALRILESENLAKIDFRAVRADQPLLQRVTALLKNLRAAVESEKTGAETMQNVDALFLASE